jgi:hypothetical protein
MTRFSEVKYHAAQQTVDVGAGVIWDDVYSTLEPFGVNALGGRVTGIGVAGFTLGGGTSVLLTVSWAALITLSPRILLEVEPTWPCRRQRNCIRACHPEWQNRQRDTCLRSAVVFWTQRRLQ